MAETKLVALVMAGGSGTRFWPQSRSDRPKQFLKLVGDRTLIAQTLDRIHPLIPDSHVYICSAKSQEPLLRSHAPQIRHFIFEPEGRNTAACLILSLVTLLRQGYSEDTVMAVFPADHFISKEQVFVDTLRRAAEFATASQGLVTLGIVPDSPHTGYGYLEAGPLAPGQTDIRRVTRFLEKPSVEKAKQFIEDGKFYWNSGVFLWTLGALKKAFQQFMPTTFERIDSFRTEEELKTIYHALKSIPIDVAVLEKSDNVYVFPVDMGWSDIGSWNALYQLHAPSGDRNVTLSGEVRARESSGNLIQVPGGKKVALVGVRDLIIVENDGVLLIAHRPQDQLVRQIATDFEKK